MGTAHYLVDHVGQNVLDIGKAWSLDLAAMDFYNDGLTPERIAAGRMADPYDNGEDSLADDILRWQAEVCGGRPLQGFNEYQDPLPWEEPDGGWTVTRKGWTVYEWAGGDPPYRDVLAPGPTPVEIRAEAERARLAREAEETADRLVWLDRREKS